MLISCARYSAAVEFNSEFLNIDDNEGVSLEKFARAQYTEPGNYLLDIAVNQRYFGTRSIEFRLSADGQGSFACLPEDLVAMFGLKPELLKTLPRLAGGQCVDLGGIDNATVKYQQNLGRLTISLPQASLEYDDPSYIPPAAWSNGLDGALLDTGSSPTTARPTLPAIRRCCRATAPPA